MLLMGGVLWGYLRDDVFKPGVQSAKIFKLNFWLEIFSERNNDDVLAFVLAFVLADSTRKLLFIFFPTT